MVVFSEEIVSNGAKKNKSANVDNKIIPDFIGIIRNGKSH